MRGETTLVVAFMCLVLAVNWFLNWGAALIVMAALLLAIWLIERRSS
jgi:cytosine/uracil/thiamine/allantoin permease